MSPKVGDAASASTSDTFDLDVELADLQEQEPYYGTDLTEVLGELWKLVEQEEVPLEKLRAGLVQANAIIEANPALATDILLPQHLAPIVKASIKLAQEKYRTQGKSLASPGSSSSSKEGKPDKPARAPSKKSAAKAAEDAMIASIRAAALAQVKQKPQLQLGDGADNEDADEVEL